MTTKGANKVMNTLIKTDDVASEGATRQGGTKKVALCDKCRGRVAWVESKNGKFYLADVFTNQSGGFYYVKASPHFKSCGRQREIREEKSQLDKWVAETDLRNFLFAVKIIREALAEGHEITLPDWWQKEYEAD